MRLTRLQRNKIYNAIAAGGLDPAECDLRQDRWRRSGKDNIERWRRLGEDEAVVSHRKSGSMFTLGILRTWAGDVYVGEHHVVDGNDYNLNAEESIDNLIPGITEWAKEVRLTVDAPDLWAELQRSRKLVAEVQREDVANTPFTEDEQRQIVAQLQEIKKQVREQFDLTNAQIAHVDEKLDEAADASKRMGRKDWLIYFLGTITALIITATVTAGVGEHIFTMFMHALGHLFTGGSEPPQIPPPTIA
jgi:hypothetical protein